jgi:hypothetical protein
MRLPSPPSASSRRGRFRLAAEARGDDDDDETTTTTTTTTKTEGAPPFARAVRSRVLG